MTAARNYSSVAAAATLTSSCSNVDTTLQVSTTSGWPAAPFALCLDKDRVGEELVLATNVAGVTLTVTRGYDGTTATSHPTGGSVTHAAIGKDFQDAGDHVGDSTLHWNSTTTDTLALPWQWSKPGAVVPSMATGTPTAITSAGPTTIVAGPGSGRRILKHLLIAGASGTTVTLTLAGTTLAKFDFSSTSAASFEMALPIANGENLQATVAGGTCVFTPCYGDRTDTQLTRLGYTSGSGTAQTLVASGTARTVTSLWISNPQSVSATANVLIDSQTITGTLTIPAKTFVSIDAPIKLTSSQALKYTGDGANAVTYLAVGY